MGKNHEIYDWICADCGRPFMNEDMEQRIVKIHWVEGYHDKYEYIEKSCCPFCNSTRIEVYEDDE